MIQYFFSCLKACADKLKREMEDFGYPPKFPDPVEEVVVEEKPDAPKDKSKGGLLFFLNLLPTCARNVLKSKLYAGKKSKLVAKSGGAKYQWQIMQSLGLKDDEIKPFADADYWLRFFPPLAKRDLMKLGLHVILVTSVPPSLKLLYPSQFYCHRWIGADLSSRRT